MKRALNVGLALAALTVTTSAAIADTRLVHSQGTANGATCGKNNNTADGTNGPCNSVQTAVNNASSNNSAPAVTIVFISNGTFAEDISLNAQVNHTFATSGGVFVQIKNSTQTSGWNVNIGGTNSLKMFDINLIGGGSGNSQGTNGVNVLSAGRVELHRVSIRGYGALSGNAFNFVPSTNSGGISDAFIIDSDIAESAGGCINIAPSGTNKGNAVIKNTQVHHCTLFNVKTDSRSLTSGNIFAKTLLSNSVISNAGNSCVIGQTNASGTQGVDPFVSVLVENTDVVNCTTGIASNGATSTVIFNNSTVSGNSTGLTNPNSGKLFSFGNNVFSFNGNNGSSPQSISPQ